MSYLLHITVSPFGENSRSRGVATEFEAAYKAAHPDETVVTLDLDKEPVPHLDGETLTAGYIPAENRPETMQAKHQRRLDYIKQITEAKAIVVATPMWNWSIPSVLKAYIDQLVLPGTLDPYSFKLLAGKPVTVIAGVGSSYGPESRHPEWNYNTTYLKFIFLSLGATDIEVIMSEYGLAGIVPGMESLVEAKETSFAAAKEAAKVRAAAI